MSKLVYIRNHDFQYQMRFVFRNTMNQSVCGNQSYRHGCAQQKVDVLCKAVTGFFYSGRSGTLFFRACSLNDVLSALSGMNLSAS